MFGLGSYEPLNPDNTRIFAHVRSFEEDVVLCVHNLARSAQAVQLDLSAYEGRWPEEMLGRTRFPRIGELPYLLTLAPRGQFWFLLTEDDRDAVADDVERGRDRFRPGPRRPERAARGRAGRVVAAAALVRLQEPRRRRGARRVGAPARRRRGRGDRRGLRRGPLRRGDTRDPCSSSWPWTPPARARRRSRRSAT